MKTQGNTIIRRLQLVFSISIILLILSLTASIFSTQKLIDNSQLVNHTNEVLLKTENIISSIREAESNQRGFVITRNQAFLDAFSVTYEKIVAGTTEVQKLTMDNPSQQQNVTELKKLVEERFAQMTKVIAITQSSDKLDSSYRAERDMELIKGKEIMDRLRLVVQNMKLEEQNLLEKRTGEQSKYISYTPVLVIMAALISIIITLMAYFRIKSDVDERVAEQIKAEEKYADTSRRISIMESITHEIAEGNYKARSLDDTDDELGRISRALNIMTQSLETTFTNLTEKNWLQEGAVKISDAIRGEKDLQKLASRLVGSLAEFLEAPVGTFYILDKDAGFKLAGTYAATNAPQWRKLGDGLIGQAAETQKIVVVNDLPANYLPISSSLGEAHPATVIIIPFVYNGETIGVVELGLLVKPEPMEIAFLEDNAEPIGIGINSALSYIKLQEFLEETQAQAEELQAQHSELENLNAELEAQAQKLQASEEELRVQQEELQQTNEELEERTGLLEEKNIEINKKAEELALTTRYKSEFLANMSHELRTPLNSILLLSRLLADNKEKTLNKDQVEYAKVIQSSGHGLLGLIDEILDLSKIEAGKMELEYLQVPIQQIADDMRVLFNPLAEEKKLAFNITIEKELPAAIETDKMRLEQILKNLLSNAIKFTSQGSVTLDIRKPAAENMICFAVRDTGIGIPEDKQQLIFEAFQQADGSTRRKYGGTGLGLSISRELSKLLGGQLRISSQENKGSEFTICVPIEKPTLVPVQDTAFTLYDYSEPAQKKEEKKDGKYISPVIPEAIDDDRGEVKPGDKVILIVEDDTNFAKSLLQYTRKKGYKGIVSVRGDEGLPLAIKFQPTGILLDIQLPIKSGWEVMDELKNHQQTRHIPVHIMSSHEVKKESLLKGAVDFINKPVAFEQLQDIFRKIEYVLNRKTKKVLIVEENPKHAKALAYFLESFNISSEVKNNIEESIDTLKRKEVDCVILDMGIPDQKAYEMLEQAKQNPGLENLPIIIFTGKSLSLAEEHRIKQYADSIIVKTAHSYQRMLDEVSLFLHLVEENKKTAAKTDSYKKLGALSQILHDKTVLIVDDDVRNIFSLTKALENLKMNVITAIDGKEALNKLQENPGIDLVLLDMMMPNMDGYETARRIRENPHWHSLPVIAVTAKAMTGDREKCINAGASDYITKPVDIDQLLSLLRVWLYERQ